MGYQLPTVRIEVGCGIFDRVPKAFRATAPARSETMEEFRWHTDCSYERSPPQYFALQVIQPDRRGGGIFSIHNVDELLSLFSPSTLKTLFSPSFMITVPPEFVKNQADTQIVGGLLALQPGTNAIKLRYREDIVTPLTTKASEAVAELKSALLGPATQFRTLDLAPEDLPRGSIVMMDNGRWLHARNEVKDPGHLRRVRWNARPFSMLSDSIHRGLRCITENRAVVASRLLLLYFGVKVNTSGGLSVG